MFTDFPVIFRGKGEGRRFPPFTNFRVVTVIFADGNGRMAHIRKHEPDLQHLVFRFFYPAVEGGYFIAERFHRRDFFARIFFTAL